MENQNEGALSLQSAKDREMALDYAEFRATMGACAMGLGYEEFLRALELARASPDRPTREILEAAANPPQRDEKGSSEG